MSNNEMNTIAAVNMALRDALEADPKVIVFGEDVADREEGGVAGATKGLSTQFGTDRVRSTPISEQAIIGTAIGASIAGYRPVAEIMLMNFVTVAMDMITNHAAKLRFMSGGQTNVPITIRMMTGAGFSNGGQHSDYLEAWFAHTPGLKVVAPSNPSDAYGLLRSAIMDDDPVIFIENLPNYYATGPVSKEIIPLGKAKVVRKGSDVTIVTYAATVKPVLAAVAALESQGISAEVIDLRTIAPWDKDTVLASAEKTGRVLIAHEAVREYGVGAEMAADINERLFGRLKAPVARVGGAFCPVPYAKNLETAFLPQPGRIEDAVEGRVRPQLKEIIMATEIILPKLGFSMNEGVLQSWLVEDGAEIAEGTPLFALESDKSVQEVEAPASGKLRILLPAGETYEVGSILGTIE